MSRPRQTIVCENCGNTYDREVRTDEHIRPRRKWCGSCHSRSSLQVAWKKRKFEGAGNPNWKGGHQHWQKGKLGRDKNGLSWKQQRELCRIRDNHTCQGEGCGKHRDQLGYEPHCDHKVPYRISFSHALDNLWLLCRSCHKKYEAQRTELWGGQTFGGVRKSKPCCSNCKKTRKLVENGLCVPCNREVVLVPKAKELRDKGISYEMIALELHVTHTTIINWLKPKKEVA